MIACRSKYNYNLLVRNYLNNYTISNPKPTNIYEHGIPEKYTSTAKYRMSFRGNYLYSYNTQIAKLIELNGKTFCLITTNQYSNTTSKHIRELLVIIHNNLSYSHIPTIQTSNLDASFNTIAAQLYEHTVDIYKELPRKQHIDLYKKHINDYIIQIESLYHIDEIKHKYTQLLANLPPLPNELNKFTRIALWTSLKKFFNNV